LSHPAASEREPVTWKLRFLRKKRRMTV
jgi:hypothetical protein